MATTSASVEVPASPQEVWQLIGGFDSLPDWLPYIPSSTLSEGGRIRSLESQEGGVIVERLEFFDDQNRTYSYSIAQAPFPVSGYFSTLRVHEMPGGQAARVEWSGTFTPVGVSDADAVALFRGIYTAGLKALRKTLTP
jgi:hypothetical protein